MRGGGNGTRGNNCRKPDSGRLVFFEVAVGTTMTISDKVTPNLVGVDIGCGMAVVELGHAEIDCNQLDKVIQEHIPSGMNIREEAIPETEQGYAFVDQILCTRGPTKREFFALSIGSLGGGNHFIELDKDDEG